MTTRSPGPGLLAHLDWRALLGRWSQEAIAHADELGLALTSESVTTGWIGRPPATEAVLAATETRLDRKLPTSLREFALITDGWPVLSMDYAALRSSADLGWVVDLEPSLVDIWSATTGDDWPADVDDGPPLSSLHLAPLGLLWDSELAGMMTTERKQRLLTTPRGTQL